MLRADGLMSASRGQKPSSQSSAACRPNAGPAGDSKILRPLRCVQQSTLAGRPALRPLHWGRDRYQASYLLVARFTSIRALKQGKAAGRNTGRLTTVVGLLANSSRNPVRG